MGVMDEWKVEKAKECEVEKLSEEVRMVSRSNNEFKHELISKTKTSLTNKIQLLKKRSDI